MAAAVAALTADKAKDAAWQGFPWPAGNKSWSVYTAAEEKNFVEKYAMPNILPHTNDPQRREGILNGIPD